MGERGVWWMLGTKQGTAGHHTERARCDINASDLASLLGVGYDSPQKLYECKTGRADKQRELETSAPFLLDIMREGQRLEPVALARLSAYLRRPIDAGYMWIRTEEGITFGATPDVRG